MKKLYRFFLLLFFISPLAAQTPQFFNFSTVGTANSFPFNQAGGKMVQWIIRAGEYNQPTSSTAGMITKFYFYCPTGGALNSTFTGFYIRMGRSSLTNLTSGSFYSGAMDTVFRRASGFNINAPADSWYEFTLDQPFLYSPDSSLIIEIGLCSSTQGTGFSINQNTTVPQQRLYSLGGCPFVYSAAQVSRTLNSGIRLDTLVGIQNNNEIPNVYKLEQNYPNPFNPSTNITYHIAKGGFVELKVYDFLGREVATLVNKEMNPGIYGISFDGSHLASGIYFYTIKAGEFIDTKMMALVK